MSSESSKGPGGTANLLDPDSGKVSQSCFDLMLIELVPMAQRLADELYARELAVTGGRLSSRRGKKEQPQNLDEDELREATFYRLEALGYRVGLGIVESLTADHPLLQPPSSNSGQAPLDTVKFLCKDLWTAVFKKQIDNLKTNHRGVFVLTDNRFEPLRRASLSRGAGRGTASGDREGEDRIRAAPFLFFPSGLVRGALSGLGIDAQVQAEVAGSGLPGAVFQIKTVGAGSGGVR